LLWRNFSKGQFVTVVPQSFEGKKVCSEESRINIVLGKLTT